MTTLMDLKSAQNDHIALINMHQRNIDAHQKKLKEIHKTLMGPVLREIKENKR